VCAMNQAIANRVSDTGLANRGMPRCRRELTGNQRRPSFASKRDLFLEVVDQRPDRKRSTKAVFS